MALRRITIDIEDSGNKYGLSIKSSDGDKSYEDITPGKLRTLVNFAVSSAMDSLNRGVNEVHQS